MPPLRLSRAQARRLAVRAQVLDRRPATDLVDLVRHLGHVQHEPTAAVAPTADIVAWSRLGREYARGDLADAVAEQRLIELAMLIRPPEDIALFRADMADWPGRGDVHPWQREIADWVEANNGCRMSILDALRADGPLPARDLPDTCAVSWRSTGWTNNRNVTQLLGFMEQRGEVAVAGRRGRDRLFDLAERVYPDDPVVPAEEATAIRNRRRLSALGIARAKAPVTQSEPAHVGDAGEEAVVDGVRGSWRVDPALLDDAPFAGRVALLSPLDRLVYDRARVRELFDFDYQLEMYKPAAKRRWGYWAMPILAGDRLVGKLDAAADRDAGVLRVHAVHRDVPFSARLADDVEREIAELADWLELELDHVAT